MRIFLPFLLLFSFSDIFAQDSTTEKIYTIVEHPPHFKEGDAALHKFLYTNIHRQSDYCWDLKAYVNFVVDTLRNLNEIKVLRNSSYPEFSEECIRVINLMSKGMWKPGELGGKKVKSRLTIPIRVRLE